MRLDPHARFSPDVFALERRRLGFGLVKILIVAAVAFWVLYSHRTESRGGGAAIAANGSFPGEHRALDAV